MTSESIAETVERSRAIRGQVLFASCALLVITAAWASADGPKVVGSNAAEPHQPPTNVDVDVSPAASDNGTPMSPSPSATDAPLTQTQEGEDVNLSAAEDPWFRIGKNMRAVQQRMHEQQIGRQTLQLQQQILRDLTALIDAQSMDEDQSQSHAGSPEDQSANAQSDTNAASGTNSGDVNTPRLDTSTVPQSDLESRKTSPRELWGHLPERFWEQLQNAGVERFLPKYEKLIEEYYKTLAESEDNP